MSSDPDPNSEDRVGDRKPEHLDLLAEEDEDPKISSNPTLFPHTPADILNLNPGVFVIILSVAQQSQPTAHQKGKE